MKTLASLKPGESGIVQNITAEGAVKQRFLDMGLTHGVQVLLERRAPFGDPLAIRLRGYTLSLRQDEAMKIALAEQD